MSRSRPTGEADLRTLEGGSQQRHVRCHPSQIGMGKTGQQGIEQHEETFWQTKDHDSAANGGFAYW
ncbi:hypothetical protein Kisp02_59820 [Kineosporia sp. NBRC 101731]|nr:hypothetical protein Kisp02_59820 [Kineosporia sp. NBRC 101731]